MLGMQNKKLKLILCGSGAAALLIVIMLVAFSGRSDIFRLLPDPGDSAYIIAETTEGAFPAIIKPLVAVGGMSDGAILDLASAAEHSAAVYSKKDDEFSLFAAHRFAKKDAHALADGKIPDALKSILGSGTAEKAGKKSFKVTGTRIYYFVDGQDTVWLNSEHSLESLGDKVKTLKGKHWNFEKKCKSHIEVCDGGAFSSKNEHSYPVKIEFAWNAPKKGEKSTVKWSLGNSDKAVVALLKLKMKPCEWNSEGYILPAPLSGVVGINMPKADSVKDLPFPMSMLATYAKGSNMKDDDILDLLSGPVVAAVGGHVKFAWFSLPGIIFEFVGSRESRNALVASLWENAFSDVIPLPLPDFEQGGIADDMFPTVAAANDKLAIAGIASPKSIMHPDYLGSFLDKNERAVGWFAADMQRMGYLVYGTMNALNTFNADEDEFGDEDEYFNGPADKAEAEREEHFMSCLHDSLQNYGTAVLVWETPLEGRIDIQSAEQSKDER